MYFHLQLGPFGISIPEPEERVTNRLRLLDWMVVRYTTQITIWRWPAIIYINPPVRIPNLTYRLTVSRFSNNRVIFEMQILFRSLFSIGISSTHFYEHHIDNLLVYRNKRYFRIQESDRINERGAYNNHQLTAMRANPLPSNVATRYCYVYQLTTDVNKTLK